MMIESFRPRRRPIGPFGHERSIADEILLGRHRAHARWYVTLSHVSTGELATAALHNDLLDDVAILKTSIADDGTISGEIKTFRQAIVTLSISSNTITPSLANGNTFYCSLTANVSTITLSGWTASKTGSGSIRFTQDGSGGKTVAFPAGWKWAGGTAPTVTATANKTTVVTFYSDDGGTTIFASVYTVNA